MPTGYSMKQTFSFEGLTKACAGSVSKSSLEHFKKKGWLRPDHATCSGTLRYTLDAVEFAKQESIKAMAIQVDFVQPKSNTADRWKSISSRVKQKIR